jgi:CRISPR/Cas system Type II protein with McrA/HNH and RuvC-like nuclease domain
MKTRTKQKNREEIFNKYNGHCAYCGTKIKITSFHMDHIESHKNSGDDSISNHNPACCSCNCSKHDLPLEVWREELSLKILRLNRDVPQYGLMKRFGLIKETRKKIIFYFENHPNNG